MNKDMIKASLARLLDAGRITQDAYNKAINKLDNPATTITEQDVVDDIVREVSA